MVKHKIREASTADCNSILSIVQNVFDYYRLELITHKEVPDLLDIDNYYTQNGTRLYIVEAKETCVGCAALFMNQSDAELKRVYIDPDSWGSGLDLSIVKHSLTIAHDHGRTTVSHWIDTRFEHVQRFFENMGFVYTGRVRPLFDINKSFEYHYHKTLNGK